MMISMNSETTFLFTSLSRSFLNNFTVAKASPLARCLLLIGMPKLFVSFPKLYES